MNFVISELMSLQEQLQKVKRYAFLSDLMKTSPLIVFFVLIG
jgi:hypothetical protein